MIKFRLILKNSNIYRYEYFSLNEEDKGVVEFNFLEEKINIIKKCESAEASEWSLFWALKEAFKRNKLKDSGTVGWY